MNEIKFFGHKQPCFFLSNFFQASFTIDGKLYRTSEHYYQSKKTTDPETEEKIRNFATPRLAADNGRKIKIREDWDEIKDDVMREAIYAKFSQNNALKISLINTGDAILEEASPTDFYWGTGGKNTGKNMLGILLMELREKLNK